MKYSFEISSKNRDNVSMLFFNKEKNSLLNHTDVKCFFKGVGTTIAGLRTIKNLSTSSLACALNIETIELEEIEKGNMWVTPLFLNEVLRIIDKNTLRIFHQCIPTPYPADIKEHVRIIINDLTDQEKKLFFKYLEESNSIQKEGNLKIA